jgi:hypothetical protein
MNAAILKNGRVIGIAYDLDSKVSSLEICQTFAMVHNIKKGERVSYVAKPFQEAEEVREEAVVESIRETPVNISRYKLSYSKANLKKAEESKYWASKVKCLNYPNGFYQLFSQEGV